MLTISLELSLKKMFRVSTIGDFSMGIVGSSTIFNGDSWAHLLKLRQSVKIRFEKYPRNLLRSLSIIKYYVQTYVWKYFLFLQNNKEGYTTDAEFLC